MVFHFLCSQQTHFQAPKSVRCVALLLLLLFYLLQMDFSVSCCTTNAQAARESSAFDNGARKLGRLHDDQIYQTAACKWWANDICMHLKEVSTIKTIKMSAYARMRERKLKIGAMENKSTNEIRKYRHPETVRKLLIPTHLNFGYKCN